MRLQVPNLLGLLRLALGAVFVLLAWRGFVYLSAIVFLTAMATDVLDGYLARKLRQETKTGIVLDALSDKLVLVAAFVVLLLRFDLPAWAAWVVIGYHVLTMIGLGILFAGRRRILEHAWTGKVAALAQTVVVPLALIGWHKTPVGMMLVWLMVGASALSAGFYLFISLRAAKK